MEFSSISKMQEYVVQAINDIIDDIAEDVRMDLRDIVRDNYKSSVSRGQSDYFAYTPTFEFLESITKAKAISDRNTINIEIYFDPSKMTPEMRSHEWWNAHMGFYGEVENVWNGMSVPELIPFWIEYGTSKGMYPREGANNVKTIFELYQKALPKLIIQELKARYNIKTKTN